MPRLAPEACQALPAQDAATDDRLLVATARELASEGVDVPAPAQISMVRVLSEIEAGVNVPVLTSLQTSLEALRELEGPPAGGQFAARAGAAGFVGLGAVFIYQ